MSSMPTSGESRHLPVWRVYESCSNYTHLSGPWSWWRQLSGVVRNVRMKARLIASALENHDLIGALNHRISAMYIVTATTRPTMSASPG
jgi:hypothetical protein